LQEEKKEQDVFLQMQSTTSKKILSHYCHLKLYDLQINLDNLKMIEKWNFSKGYSSLGRKSSLLL